MAEENTFNPHLIIPVGTQVVTLFEVKGRAAGRVCPRGAVGEVIAAPQDNSHSYHVRFPDGTENDLLIRLRLDSPSKNNKSGQ